MSTLTPRGPRANTPAKLPALQSIRVADPNVRQALQTLQEWVEVRLGVRGDRYERAVTFREFDPIIEELDKRITALEAADVKFAETVDSLQGNIDSLLRRVAGLEQA